MIDVEVSTTIDRPIDDVFAFVADMTNEPRWHTDPQEINLTSEGEVGKGATYQVKFKPSRMSPPEATAVIVDFEPGQRVASRSDMGNMNATVTHTFESVDAGTLVTRRIQIETSGLMSLMSPMMKSMVRKRNVGFIANLKELLES